MRLSALLAVGVLAFSSTLLLPLVHAQTAEAEEAVVSSEAAAPDKPEATVSATFGKKPAPLPDNFGVSTSLLEVTLNLAVVLAAIVLLAWIVKRVQGVDHPSAGQLRVAASLPLGPKERLLVVDVGEKQLLLGATQSGINTLHVLEQRLVVPAPEDESFRDKLRKSLKGAST